MSMIPSAPPSYRPTTNTRYKLPPHKAVTVPRAVPENIVADPARWPILPHCIYAAKRNEFELTANPDLSKEQILALAFELLPLTEHGWAIDKTEVRHLHGNNWLVRRQ